MFGIDYQYEGALVAMAVHPPAFGLKLKSFDDSQVRTMPGIEAIFEIRTLEDDYERNYFDTDAFTNLVAIVGKSTWEVMNAKKALQVEWEPISDSTFTLDMFGNKREVQVPAGLESTQTHNAKMAEYASKPGKQIRKDGYPEAAFKNAAKIIERSYSCPFLAHNCMEPMNFFAHVTEDSAKLAGPLQAPGFIEGSFAARLGLPIEK
jgi:isoquinoline 1-oxidoreductase beta subunit